MLLVGLPIAVWLDLRDISETLLRRQTTDLDRIVTDIRGFYASDVVARVLTNTGHTTVSAHYETIPGAIPIPATFSLKLGEVIDEYQGNIAYRFVSDFPFGAAPLTSSTPSSEMRCERSAAVPSGIDSTMSRGTESIIASVSSRPSS